MSAAQEVEELWTSRGLDPRPYAGAYDHLYIDIYPPQMQVEAGGHVPRRQLMRPVTDDNLAGLSEWRAREPAPRRRSCTSPWGRSSTTPSRCVVQWRAPVRSTSECWRRSGPQAIPARWGANPRR